MNKLKSYIINNKLFKSQNEKAGIEKYYGRINNMSIYNGCLFYGKRIIVPYTLRNKVLKLLHISHTGITKTKRLARDNVWWPGIDKEVEKMISTCNHCTLDKLNKPKKELDHP